MLAAALLMVVLVAVMNKQDIDQSHTSWLIYSDYLEENGQLALAEQIRFELDYRPSNYPPPYGSSDGGDVGSYGYGRDVGGVGSDIGGVGIYGNDIGGVGIYGNDIGGVYGNDIGGGHE